MNEVSPSYKFGPAKVVSILTFIALLTVVPYLAKPLWPSLLEIFTPFQLYLYQSVFLNFLVLGLFNLCMYFVYTGKYEFFEQYRIRDKQWPWEEDSQKWRKYLKKTMTYVLMNMFIFIPVFNLMDYFTHPFEYKSAVQDWPTFTVVLGQFIFFLLVEDVSFYWIHRLLHHPSFYWIHKKHHEYNNTITLAATYCHPIEFIIGNGLPYGLGFRILCEFADVHIVTITVWTIYRLLETCQGHSGYEFPWAQLTFLPQKLDSQYHDFHHAYNSGNFGSQFGFWDTISKTNQTYLKYIKKKKN